MSGNQNFVRSGFGSNRRIPVIDFVVFGLLTFWIYSVIRMGRHLRVHYTSRWREFADGLDAEVAADIRLQGFTPPTRSLAVSALLFAVAAVLVALWFYGFVLSGYLGGEEKRVVFIVALSSGIFYLGTLIAIVSVARSVKSHEIVEAMLRSLGGDEIQNNEWVAADELNSRWEQIHAKLTLFLVVSLPMVFSPAVGAHLFLSNVVTSNSLLLALAGSCFVFAAVFHVWGTSVLLGLLNSHLDYEAHCVLLDLDVPGFERTENGGHATGEVRRLLITIMLTDIVGYSRAMETDEDGMYSRLIEHNEIMRTSIADHRGREIKTIGDAFLVVFDSALDAVNCGLAMQRNMVDYNADRESNEKVMVRIGIHIGDVIVTDTDVYGDGVNITARIESLADAGGICISHEVYSLVRKKLVIEIEHLEDPTLKNIALAPDIYKIHLR